MKPQPKFLIISVIVLSIGCVVAFLALAVIADSRVTLPIPVGATTPTPRIHVTTLFFGRAYVDANGNGQIDPSDPPLAGAMFTARDARGVVASGITASDGHATASIPDVAVRPITLQMQPPKGSSYILIGPQEIVGADVSGSFLFALAQTPSPSQTLPPRPTLTAKPSIVPPATETRAAWSTLLAQARAADPTRYQFALDQGAQIIPTNDGKSFYVLWLPPQFQTAPRRVMIATLHGHASWAFDEFYLWQPYAAQRGYAMLALQWWFGGGEDINDYYLPQAMYPILESVFRQHHLQPNHVLLHGFSRGSTNVYALTALDRSTRQNFIGLTIANAGMAAPDFPPTRDITDGKFGTLVFAGTHWVMYCGEHDPNPNRDGCPAMRQTRDWVTRLGGTVDLLIEDKNGEHGGFHRNSANVIAALDVFARLLDAK